MVVKRGFFRGVVVKKEKDGNRSYHLTNIINEIGGVTFPHLQQG